jgi:hypothetical protein
MTGKRRRSRKPSGTKAESLLEASTFFVDECLGKGVGIALREAGLLVQLHKDHFKEGTPDEIWIPEVGARGWVVLTKDKAIRRNSAERRAVIVARARILTLPRGSYTGAEMAEIILSNRPKIGRFLKNHPPPFIARISASGIELSELPDDPTTG